MTTETTKSAGACTGGGEPSGAAGTPRSPSKSKTTPEGWLVDRYRLETRPGMGEVFIEDRGNGKWVVKNNPDVLNRFFEWEYEPLPSSRDEAFIERTRFNSPEEASNAFKQVAT